MSAADVPDLTAAIMADAVLPVRKVLRRRIILRGLLLVVGLIQLALAVAQLNGDDVGMAMSLHAVHEAAAWNIAIGVAFLGTVIKPRRAAGLIAVLACFIGVLTVLCIRDLVAGVVTADRLATHIAAAVGLLLLIGVDRVERALPPRSRAGGDDKRVSRNGSGSDSGSGSGGHLRGVA